MPEVLVEKKFIFILNIGDMVVKQYVYLFLNGYIGLLVQMVSVIL